MNGWPLITKVQLFAEAFPIQNTNIKAITLSYFRWWGGGDTWQQIRCNDLKVKPNKKHIYHEVVPTHMLYIRDFISFTHYKKKQKFSNHHGQVINILLPYAGKQTPSKANLDFITGISPVGIPTGKSRKVPLSQYISGNLKIVHRLLQQKFDHVQGSGVILVN